MAYGLEVEMLRNGLRFYARSTALVEVVYNGGKLWVRELIYETGLTNADIAAKCGLERHDEIIADSAEPKLIKSRARFSVLRSKSARTVALSSTTTTVCFESPILSFSLYSFLIFRSKLI